MAEHLPCEECGGQCCGFMPATEAEFQRIVAAHPLPDGAAAIRFPTRLMGMGRVVMMPGGGCPYLRADRRCSIYADRPQTCRDYGLIAGMPCMYLHPEAAGQQVNRWLESGGLARKENP